MGNVHFADLAIWFPAFLFSLTFHEAAHAWTSRHFGDRTAEDQVTLNPIPHILQEPFGTIVLPLIFFFLAGWVIGWASTPYDPVWARRNPRAAGIMSLAGPVANFVLAGLTLGVIWALVSAGTVTITPWGRIPDFVSASGNVAFGAKFLSVLYFLNLILGFFNLIPVPPLDGAGIVEGFFPRSGFTRLIQRLSEGGFAWTGIIIAYFVFSYAVFPFVNWLGFTGLGVHLPLKF